MVAQEFTAGNPPGGSGPWVEWDGSNQDDVVEWLNSIYPEWNQEEWTYAIVDDQLVISGSYSGAQPPLDAGAWVKLRWPSGGPNYLDVMPPEVQTGMWKTRDPWGRAPSVDWLVGPADGSGQMPDPVELTAPEQHMENGGTRADVE
jgi:hypothetical protein